jgi:hypothetical protein
MKTQNIKQRVSELKDYLDHYELIEKLEQLIMIPKHGQQGSSNHPPEEDTSSDDTSDSEKFHHDKQDSFKR